jgi:CRISPR-associated protein Cas1
MIARVIEIATEGCHLARYHGSLVISKNGEEQGRVPLDDIGVLLCTARDVTYSNTLLVELARRGAATVLCGNNYLPSAWIWPVEGHHVQAMNMRFQIDAPKPLKKRLWQNVVRAKIARQKSALEVLSKPSEGFDELVRKVRSGDPTNVESQAARKYWPLVFGPEFRRKRYGSWPNSALNYGYTVLRATVARAIASAGLHPSIGIHHSNRGNPFCLSDDLLEPYRPLVDCSVARLIAEGHTELAPESKRLLAQILVLDMDTDQGTTPLQTCVHRTAQSLAKAYITGNPSVSFPQGMWKTPSMAD